MPRTTVNLDAPVLAELKRLQQLEKKPLGQLISELVVQGLNVRKKSAPSKLRWTSKPMGQPFIDIDDKEALYTALEEM